MTQQALSSLAGLTNHTARSFLYGAGPVAFYMALHGFCHYKQDTSRSGASTFEDDIKIMSLQKNDI
jgi:hypothetical protein